jgi:RNA polymerase sigma-70 factor, ECF subfamily
VIFMFIFDIFSPVLTGVVLNQAESLETLVEKARSGDREAQGRIAERSSGRLRSWIQGRLGRRLGRWVSAEDLSQETFFQAFRDLPRLEWRGEEAFHGWLQAIAEHLIQGEVKRLRAKKRTMDREVSLQEEICVRGDRPVTLTLEDSLGARCSTPSKRMRREERFEKLEKALASLAPDYREVILLVNLRSVPMKEAAARMGRSLEAASMLHLRAIRKLREAFGNADSTDSFYLPDDRTLDPGKEESRGE